MKTLLLTFFLILFTFTAQARLGESIAECRARYGDPIEADEKARVVAYGAGGFIVMAWFDLDGYCEMIVFSRDDKEALTENQKKILVEANLGTETKPIDAGINQGMINPEGNVSLYQVFEEQLIFRTTEKIERDAREQKEAERSALQGF